MMLRARTALVLLALASASAPLAAQSTPAAGFEDGISFWVWRALPQVFPEYVPGAGGYLSFGFQWNLGEQLPVGLTVTDDGIPLIRTESGPAGVGGAPPDLDAYREFLVAAARDPRFTADNIMPIIQYNVRLSWIEKLRYRYRVIPGAREALLRLADG